jgi:hypothetical protein
MTLLEHAKLSGAASAAWGFNSSRLQSVLATSYCLSARFPVAKGSKADLLFSL